MARKKKFKWVKKTSFVVASVGAINWGLAEFNFNLVDKIFGTVPFVETAICYVIGVAGVLALYHLFKK